MTFCPFIRYLFKRKKIDLWPVSFFSTPQTDLFGVGEKISASSVCRWDPPQILQIRPCSLLLLDISVLRTLAGSVSFCAH